MSTSSGRRRVSYTQLEALYEALTSENNNKALATGNNKTALARELSRRMWVNVAKTLNEVGDGTVKDWKGWCKYWNDYKSKLKSRLGSRTSQQLSSSHSSGLMDGPAFTELEEMFLQLMAEGINSDVTNPGVKPIGISATPVITTDKINDSDIKEATKQGKSSDTRITNDQIEDTDDSLESKRRKTDDHQPDSDLPVCTQIKVECIEDDELCEDPSLRPSDAEQFQCKHEDSDLSDCGLQEAGNGPLLNQSQKDVITLSTYHTKPHTNDPNTGELRSENSFTNEPKSASERILLEKIKILKNKDRSERVREDEIHELIVEEKKWLIKAAQETFKKAAIERKNAEEILSYNQMKRREAEAALNRLHNK